jgi:hypothetical protein
MSIKNLKIEGNYLLIYSLFKNLIDNSIEHAGEGFEIFIKETGTDRQRPTSHTTIPEKGLMKSIFTEFSRDFTEWRRGGAVKAEEAVWVSQL